MSIEELKRAIKGAKEVCNPRAIVVINPGNPTGKLRRKTCHSDNEILVVWK